MIKSISDYGDFDKVGNFSYCKWITEENKFCHDQIDNSSSYSFCEKHIKKVIRPEWVFNNNKGVY